MYNILVQDKYTGKTTTFTSKEDRDEAVKLAKSIRLVWMHVSVQKHGAVVWEKSSVGCCVDMDIPRPTKSQWAYINGLESRGIEIKRISKSMYLNNHLTVVFKNPTLISEITVNVGVRGAAHSRSIY